MDYVGGYGPATDVHEINNVADLYQQVGPFALAAIEETIWMNAPTTRKQARRRYRAKIRDITQIARRPARDKSKGAGYTEASNANGKSSG